MFVNRKFHRMMRPLGSPDLTPLDFFLWEHVKSVAYQNNERNIQELKENITLKSPNLQYIYILLGSGFMHQELAGVYMLMAVI